MFEPSTELGFETGIVYVSNSEGDDANNGFSPATSVKTLARGYSLMRDGYPDWLLLKRGDTWTNEYLAASNADRRSSKYEGRYKKFKNDPLFIFGLGLYWGEGDKKSGNMVAVTNSDPNILSVIAKFYRKYLSLDESKLGIKLFIYKDINIDFAIDFWSKLLKIPRNQFIKVQILESRAKLTKTKLKYGICTLYCSNTEFHIKIREWIRLLSLDMRV